MDITTTRLSPCLAELDYYSDNTLLYIQTSRRTTEALDLASVELPRFRMYERRQVPLWLGVALERKGQATVERPGWLGVEALKAKIAEERRVSMETLTEMPEFFESVARKLLRPEEEAAVLVQDLLAIRRSKILATVKTIDIRFVHANVKTWTAMERALFRVGAVGMLDKINELVGDTAPRGAGSQQDSYATFGMSSAHSG